MRSLTLPTILSLLSTALASPAATALNQLPACAQQAGLAAIDATGCALTDTYCICTSVPFLETLRAYIVSSCSIADQATALTFGQEFCLEASVTISAIVTGATGMVGGPIMPLVSTAVMGTATSTMSMPGSTAADVAPDVATASDTMSATSTTVAPSTFTGAAVKLGGEAVVALAGIAGVVAMI